MIVRAHRPAVKVNQRFDNSQAQSTRARLVFSLYEAVEDTGQEVGVDAGAVVLDAQGDCVALFLKSQTNDAPVRYYAKRIVEQIAKDLRKPLRVRADIYVALRTLEKQLDACLVGAVSAAFQDTCNTATQLEPLQIK